VTLTADVTLLPAGIDEDLSRELIALLDREPQQVAAQVRAWMAEDQA
jgi:hypothetical protein